MQKINENSKHCLLYSETTQALSGERVVEQWNAYLEAAQWPGFLVSGELARKLQQMAFHNITNRQLRICAGGE